MFWGKGPDKPSAPKESPSESSGAAKDGKDAIKNFDPQKLPEREKLPSSLQNLVAKADKQENVYNELVDG